MRIISKFQDYYDGVQAYGHDGSLTFVRQKREYHFKYGIEEGKAPHGYPKGLNDHYAPDTPSFGKKSWEGHANGMYLLGFCGKVYFTYLIDGSIYTSVPDFFRAVDRGTSVDNLFTHPNPDGMIAYAKDNWERERQLKRHRKFVEKARERDRNKITGQNKKYVPWSARDNERHFFFSEREWSRWLEYSEGKMVMPDKSFRDYESPILLYTDIRSSQRLIVNPCLKDYGFSSLIDPWTAFQEIDMYLGNNMADQFDPSANRTDIEIRDSKGMDEWSFRNPSPGKKKRKQRK